MPSIRKTRTLRVEADIPNPDHALVPGMYVNVDFQVPTEGLVQVPAAALVFRSDGPHVGVVDNDNRVDFSQSDDSPRQRKYSSARAGCFMQATGLLLISATRLSMAILSKPMN